MLGITPSLLSFLYFGPDHFGLRLDYRNEILPHQLSAISCLSVGHFLIC